jgi:hypothetical protein
MDYFYLKDPAAVNGIKKHNVSALARGHVGSKI